MKSNLMVLYKRVVFSVSVLVISIAILGDTTCTFSLKDSWTGEYVPDSNITIAPELTQTAAPGTGGSGPMIYEISFPKIAHVSTKAYGYEEKSITLLLFPGRSVDILFEKKQR